jgi:hypothetical protein
LVALAACSKSTDGKGVASASGSARPSPTPSLSDVEQGRRHAQCMRDNGVPEQDPRTRPDGTVQIGGGYDKDAVDQNTLRNAIAACRAFEIVLAPEDQARKLHSQREYSRCMRAHGVEDFPDPDANGQIILPDEITDPDFDAAKAFCEAQDASPSRSAS